jgi:2-hydroxy-6-oxonona-2,4-dienedioate hydrolase
MAERIVAAEFRLIKNAGHWPQWEQRDEFDDIVLEFLGRDG